MIKQNQQKRRREESSKKKSEEKSAKRAKIDESMEDAKSTKSESHGKHDQEDEKSLVKEEATSLNNAEEAMISGEEANDGSEMDEDPEEDPEEESEMPDTSPQYCQAEAAKVCLSLLPLHNCFYVLFSVYLICVESAVC